VRKHIEVRVVAVVVARLLGPIAVRVEPVEIQRQKMLGEISSATVIELGPVARTAPLRIFPR
jgi:hypothetical protein